MIPGHIVERRAAHAAAPFIDFFAREVAGRVVLPVHLVADSALVGVGEMDRTGFVEQEHRNVSPDRVVPCCRLRGRRGKGGMQAASRMQAKCRHGTGKRLADGYAVRAMCKTPQGQMGGGDGRKTRAWGGAGRGGGGGGGGGGVGGGGGGAAGARFK